MQSVYLNKISQTKLAYVTSVQIKKSEECQCPEAPLRQLPVINREAIHSYLINSPGEICPLGALEYWNK